MSSVHIYHHLGLGDHIICNGLVRTIAEKYDKVFLFVKAHNHYSVEYMYRDINLELIIADDKETNRYIQKYNITKLIKIGFKELSGDFDKSFYELAGIDFTDRWDKFKVKRDKKRESNLFKRLELSKPYIFLHEDKRRKMVINRDKLKGTIFTPNRYYTNNIFDYCYIIEQADEVHCIESSFGLLIDSLNLNKNTFIHRYARETNQTSIPYYRNIKNILC